ncbi:hypothetical protein HII31_07416 [Pseudocercospora fuligena]|uniref:Uncharacterized protein n=1 Tax=Pseudocercospora fuligena TaxID=685502 RepID=A0A8H6RI89_9PEZI|nr:hypothetical protein HII31_07416 [Pseudocercospora fuligena]
MLSFSLAILTAAGVVAAAPALDAVRLFTDDLDALNSIGVSEMLSGWEDVGLILKGVYFHEMPTEDNYTQLDARTPFDLLEARAPAASCGSPSCTASNTNYKLFTPAQEEFIAGKFCPFVARYSPPVGTAVVGYYFSKAVCSGNTACELIANLGGAFGGANSAFDSLKDAFTETLKSIQDGCGNLGGSETCTVGSLKGTYTMKATSSATKCPATKCQNVVCSTSNDNCQKY